MTYPDSTSKFSNSPIPDAYTKGWVPFLDCRILLDSKPLIPRPETEWWCEKAIGEICKRAKPRVLDLFSGSGCIGIAVLKHVPDAIVDFGELDTRHLATIKKNIGVNITDRSRSRIIQTDVWNAVSDTYDFVLANPPYLTLGRRERIQDSVIEHEPLTALFADDDGFALIQSTLQGAPAHLNPGGRAWIEHEPEHTTRVRNSAQSIGLLASTHRDQYGQERYSVILAV